ncbi:MAG: hypothetical protein IT462_17790 [Planctomycetes bacterium]|nr:hypothetical protein [Planctomycetota bacterium]
MKKVFVLLCLVSIAWISACSTTEPAKPTGGGGESTAKKKGPSDEQVAAVKEEYMSGKRNAASNVPLPGSCTVGQVWEVKFTKDGKEVTETLQVAHRIGRNLVVEHMTADGVVVAYEIDRNRSAEQGNVKRAWVGKKGWDPYEIKTASGWALPDAGTLTQGWTAEPFADVEVAGKKWSGTCYGKGDSKIWVAERGYFNGIIKATGSEGEWMLVKADFKEKPKVYLTNWEFVKPAA